jgi:hypothetical protein
VRQCRELKGGDCAEPEKSQAQMVAHVFARFATPQIGPHWTTTRPVEVIRAADACGTVENVIKSYTELGKVRSRGTGGYNCMCPWAKTMVGCSGLFVSMSNEHMRHDGFRFQIETERVVHKHLHSNMCLFNYLMCTTTDNHVHLLRYADLKH